MANDTLSGHPRESNKGVSPAGAKAGYGDEGPAIVSADLRKVSDSETESKTGAFDLSAHHSPIGTTLLVAVSRLLPAFFWVLRNVYPNLRIGKLQFVSRYHDVRDVLDRDDVFEIPFDHKMEKLGWNPGFLLGMQDGKEYQETKSDVYRIFKRQDMGDINKMSGEFAYEILKEHANKGTLKDGEPHGRIDAVKALIRRVPTLVVEKYYGVEIKNKYEFEDCLIALSGYLFGSAGKKDDKLPAHIGNAYERARNVIQDAVTNRKPLRASDPDDILGRMLHEQSKDPRWTDDRIVSYLFGMILGFLPTNLMANGNMLEALMKHKLERAQSRRAALDDDDALLCRCLFETMRRRIPLNPGPWRRAADNYTLVKKNTGLWSRIVRRRFIEKGTTVWPLTQSAMRDSRGVRRPREFDPDRSREHNLVFGDGLHHCIGRRIAEVQITQTMKALLCQDNLEPAKGREGKMKRISMFPLSQTLRYEFRPPLTED